MGTDPVSLARLPHSDRLRPAGVSGSLDRRAWRICQCGVHKTDGGTIRLVEFPAGFDAHPFHSIDLHAAYARDRSDQVHYRRVWDRTRHYGHNCRDRRLAALALLDLGYFPIRIMMPATRARMPGMITGIPRGISEMIPTRMR